MGGRVVSLGSAERPSRGHVNGKAEKVGRSLLDLRGIVLDFHIPQAVTAAFYAN